MLLKALISLFRYFIFWLAFFFLERLVFLLYNYSKLEAISFSEVSRAFGYGLWMDASMAGYISAIPLIVFLGLWIIPKARISSYFIKIYTRVLIVLFSLLTVINFNIYREWGSKVNYRAFEFTFGSPKEALASTGSSPVLLSVFIFLLLSFLGIFLFNQLNRYGISKTGNLGLKLVFAILLLGLDFLAIRGGWQLSPMNESMAYYSSRPLLNYAAVNTEWSLGTDILNSKNNSRNPYQYLKHDQAKAIIKQYYTQNDTPRTSILSDARPNVVFIIMESFTGNVVPRLGGEKGISNALSKLMETGVFFDNIYASGARTDKGVVAVLSAFPAQGPRSIMKENSKQEKIPSVPQVLNEQGYHSSFFYGGESRFFNMRSYLLSHGFSTIVDKANFNAADMNSKWGAYDGNVYQTMTKDLGQQKQPFFATLLSLTNHEPFELPVSPHFKGTDVENKFRSTAFYADSCLGAFIQAARTQPWYPHTLFVVVADHGHYLPRTDLEAFNPQRYRIPLLLFGDVIKPEYRGMKVSKIGSQTDVAATVLSQLKLDSRPFSWSKDLLNPATKDFAFFNWDQGFGFAVPGQIISYDAIGNKILYQEKPASAALDRQALNSGKSFMQEIYQKYMDYAVPGKQSF